MKKKFSIVKRMVIISIFLFTILLNGMILNNNTNKYSLSNINLINSANAEGYSDIDCWVWVARGEGGLTEVICFDAQGMCASVPNIIDVNFLQTCYYLD